MKKISVILCLCVSMLFGSSASFAADLPAGAGLSLDDVVKNLQSNQAKIKDLYAETETTIVSNMAVPGSKEKGPQKMVQKGKMWTKGESKSKIEMSSPMKQVTITNGDKMAIINSDTGQKVVQDMKKLRQQSGQGTVNSGQMSLDKAKEVFDLSAAKKGDLYVITGVPKKDNKFLGKMEFYVDAEKWVPVKILMYDGKGKPISQSEIQYQEVSDVWVPVKNSSNITTPMGAMKVEMEFSNIKVNKGINDKEFKIE